MQQSEILCTTQITQPYIYCIMIRLLLLLSFLLATQAFFLRQQSSISAAAIAPGRGYSSDKQQMSPLTCFNAKPSPYTKTTSVVRFDQGTTYSQLKQTFKIDVNVKVKIFIFSVDVDVSYMKEITDTDFTMTINYYQYVQSELSMEYGYGAAAVLTPEGLRQYGSDSNPNPNFGLNCGDKFVNSFKSGANLIFSIKLHFQTHTEKEQFQGKFDSKFGPWTVFSADVQKYAESVNMSGRVDIMASQSGGNPKALEKMMNKSCGDYCAATCTMKTMTDCSGAINSLFDYAINSFPSQINIQDPTTMVPFAIGFADIQDVSWIGLKSPSSFATKEVVAMREVLANSLLASQYYKDSLPRVAQSKLPWDKNSALYRSIGEIVSGCQPNIDLLMDQNQGAIVCYNSPQTCVQNGNKLLQRLHPVQIDASLLLSKIKYKLLLDVCSATVYRIGDDKWYFPKISSPCTSMTIRSMSASAAHLSYTIEATISGQVHTFTTIGNLTAATESSPYIGDRQQSWPNNKQTLKVGIPKEPSQYSIDAYK